MVLIYVTDIQGKKHEFVVTQDSDESIVDIAERNGVELPYSCKSGACFSCCAKITQ
ncbi:2Fe-2S iron-sulfur cluster binding domain-containing protein [Patescibacteria group bacterium]|nr:2Fe-2S iron-sulfur cluster binding domain-containing protein [Patescibacteria group bacterium]